jgi:hypothetical protein
MPANDGSESRMAVKTLLVTALRAFPLAETGHATRWVAEGEEIEVPEPIAASLAGEGFIDGREHGLPILTAARRAQLTEEMVTAFRAEMAKEPDEGFLSCYERFKAHHASKVEAAAEIEPGPDEDDLFAETTLLGSSILPAHIAVGEHTIQLGTLVVTACRMTNHTNASWNALPEPYREQLLETTIDALADPTVFAREIPADAILPPEPKPAPVEKAAAETPPTKPAARSRKPRGAK